MRIQTLKRVLQVCAGLALALAVALPTQLQAQSVAAASPKGAAFAAEASAGQACLFCENCQINGRTGHRTENRPPGSGELGIEGDEAHGCEDEGSCCNSPHGDPCGACGVAAAPLVQPLAKAVEQHATSSELGRLVEATEEAGFTVEINHVRSAIQLIGCSDNVVAHMALEPKQLAALEASEWLASRELALAGQ